MMLPLLVSNMGRRIVSQEEIVNKVKFKIEQFEHLRKVALENNWTTLHSYYNEHITQLKIELAEEEGKLNT